MRKVVVLVLVLTGCERSFGTATQKPLSVTPQFAQVAPRESRAVEALGGQPPYAFAFKGAPGSGASASVDGGLYQAGAEGPGQDVVEVTDARGQTADATFAVGERLRLQSPTDQVDPGASVQLTAAGGKPPYAYAVAGCFADGGFDPEGSGATVSRDTGLYVAGPRGNSYDCVTASDATQDPQVRSTLRLQVRAPPALTISPTFAQVPPRGQVSFTAAGGAGGYTFTFQGGAASGPHASLQQGAYQAGEVGNAQDTVVVTDAAGATAQAKVAVGPPLSITPAAVSLAPGGQVQFTVVGGAPPYAFSLPPECASGPSDATGQVDATGLYLPGPSGPHRVCVQVTDTTQATDSLGLAHAEAQVQVGPELQLVAAGLPLTDPDAGLLATVPPGANLTFIGVYGQPPYTFSLGTTDGGSSIDPVTGSYRATLAGSTQDVVHVRDANAQDRALTVPVGPALALAVGPGGLHPSLPVQLLATGGRAPYVFGFAPKGNRSNGAVEASTGVYTPGLNFGAQDLLQVVDAAGVAATVSPGAVGPLQVPYGNVNRLVPADLDGDGRKDLVLLSLPGWSASPQRVVTAISVPGGPPRTTVGAFGDVFRSDGGPDKLMDALAADVDRDGHDDLVYLSYSSVGLLHAAVDGSLQARVPVFQRTSDPYGLPSSAFAVTTRGGYPQVFFYDPSGGLCSNYVAGGPGGIVEVDFPSTSATPSAPTCRVTVNGDVDVVAAGDWNGDGAVDVAWVDDENSFLFDQLHLDFGGGALPAETLTLPGSASDIHGGGYPSSQVMPVAASPDDPKSDDLVVLLDPTSTSTGTAAVVGLTHGSPPVLGALVDPFAGTSHQAETIGAFARSDTLPDDAFLAWNGYQGSVVAFRLDGSGAVVPLPPPAPDLGSQVDCAVSPDFNGDGIPDFAYTAGGIAATTILWGEGDGTFARLPRFDATASAGVAQGDVDGDGVPDLVRITGRTAQPLFGGGGQLAYGPTFALPTPPIGMAIADFDGHAPDDLALLGNAGGITLIIMEDGGAPGAQVPLLQTDGGEFPLQLVGLQAANFGGAAPGLDLWTSNTFPPEALRFYIRDSSDPAHLAPDVGHSVDLALPGTYDTCLYAALDLNGDGLADLAAFCSVRTGAGDGGRLEDDSLLVTHALDGGANLAFDGWQDAGYLVRPVARGSVQMGTLGSTASLATFIAHDEQDPNAPNTLIWVVTPAGVQSMSVPYRMTRRGLAGPMGPGGADAFAGLQPGLHQVHFFDRQPDGSFAERASTLVAGGALYTAIPASPGAPADLVMQSGTDVVFHPNDGGALY